GPRNLITDVPGVTVGQFTRAQGAVQTGVTVLLPHGGNLFRDKVVAACHVINGFGKSAGLVQLEELGTIESPIVLTNTFGVGTAINAVVRRALAENPEIGVSTGTMNPLVLECNDGILNDIRGMHVTEADVWAALDTAAVDFAEGAVGAGRGMCCYGLKGGIGSASRQIRVCGASYTVGALLMTNFGETPDLLLRGDPVGRRLTGARQPDRGSVIVVLATDLPLSARQLERVTNRAQSGLARTGAYVANGSGELVVAFTTANRVPHFSDGSLHSCTLPPEEALDALFRAATDCVEESVLSSLVHGETVVGRDGNRRLSLKDALAEIGETL
ncbi:MAG: P1 family peptidase, partial [Oscillospiraceae bacterium]